MHDDRKHILGMGLACIISTNKQSAGIQTMSLSDKPSMSEIASKGQSVIARLAKKCHEIRSSGTADTNNVCNLQSNKKSLY